MLHTTQQDTLTAAEPSAASAPLPPIPPAITVPNQLRVPATIQQMIPPGAFHEQEPRPETPAGPVSCALAESPDAKSPVYLASPTEFGERLKARLLKDEAPRVKAFADAVTAYRRVWKANVSATHIRWKADSERLEKSLRSTPEEKRPAVEAEIQRLRTISDESRNLASDAIGAAFLTLRKPLAEFVEAAQKRLPSYALEHTKLEREAAEKLGVETANSPYRKGVASLERSLASLLRVFDFEANHVHPHLHLPNSEGLGSWFGLAD